MKKLRRQFFEWVIYEVCGHREAQILDRWMIAFRFLLFPIGSIYWWYSDRNGYQVMSDSWEINGLRISNRSFRFLEEVGSRFEILEIDSDGVVTLKRIDK